MKDGAPEPWEFRVKTGTTNARIVTDDDVIVLYMLADNSSFSLNRKVDIDAGALPHLSWKWQVDRLPHGKSKDEEKDQSLQLFLFFKGGETLNYNWETNRPVGAVFAERIPFFANIKTLVLESGTAKLGTWVKETRDVASDYKHHFGKDSVPRLEGIRIQSNSQYTGTTGSGYMAPLVFSDKE